MLIENNNICKRDNNTVDELLVKLQFFEKKLIIQRRSKA